MRILPYTLNSYVNVPDADNCRANDVNCVQIFCVHGGIPSPTNGGGFIEAINSIPVPLPDPEMESSLAWEMMWSDPLQYVFIRCLLFLQFKRRLALLWN